MNSPIRVYIKDINNTGELPRELTIQCTGVPRLGDVINVFEILPEEEREESGWWYKVERVEWSIVEGKTFEPIVTIRKQKV